ncbi:general substrate transporter [Mrakia frigida]|uniref:Vvs1p n=1 Tax=Mrakia frigida TaxID=29902 RepID=UPI003FCC1170
MEVSVRFTLLVFWLCLSSFIYGFHISALNSPQSVIICPSTSSLPPLHHLLPSPPSFLPPCLDITTAQFGFITAAFTFGGLFGCLSSPAILPSLTIKRSLVLCALVSLLGGLVQSLAPGLWIMLFGRALTGFGAALGICVVPPALGLIAPEKIRGSVGVLHQLSIVTGILMAQLSGLYLSQPSTWRYIPFLSSLVCFVQLLLSPLVPSPDSPRITLSSSPKLSSRAIEEEGLLSEEEAEDDETRARRALAEEELVGIAAGGEKPMGVWEMLRDRDIRRGVLCCLGAMLLQQFSGINAVFFFSVSILTPLMPTNAPLIALYLTIFNFIMTFPAVYLVERLGRRTLLLGSIAGMGVASMCLGYGLNEGKNELSAVGVFAFVGSFAIGLGPVPFIIISELVPPPARSSLSSLSLLVNFVSNLAIGALFLPVRLALSSPKPTPEDPEQREGEGTVFYLFAGCLILGGLALGRGWRSG